MAVNIQSSNGGVAQDDLHGADSLGVSPDEPRFVIVRGCVYPHPNEGVELLDGRSGHKGGLLTFPRSEGSIVGKTESLVSAEGASRSTRETFDSSEYKKTLVSRTLEAPKPVRWATDLLTGK